MDNNTDYDRLQAFLRLTERERFIRLFNMLMNMAANRAVDTKIQSEILGDLDVLKRTLEGISHRKDDTLTTNEKIDEALNRKNAAWKWYQERILTPTLVALHLALVMGVVTGLLYLAFGLKP